MSRPVDVLVLSLGTTRGLRIADAQLASIVRQAGASVAVVGTRIGATNRLRRGYPVNDIVEAIAARRALDSGLRRHRPRAAVLSSTTAAMLAGAPAVPFAVWLDSPARLNRPGRRNALLHVLERRQLARARIVLVLSHEAVAALPAGAAPAVVVSPPLTAPPPPAGSPPLTAPPPRAGSPGEIVVAYTPDPKARDLELVCAAWATAAAPGARLVVTGISAERARAFLRRRGVEPPPGLELAGMLPQAEFRALLLRARVFLSAARWEDFGQTPLQALDCGAAIVSAPAGGPFPALAIARQLAPRFVAPDRSPRALAAALEAALAASESELDAYRAAARERLAPYREAAVVERVREQVLPVLLGP
jgi:glycosyltransferase involved in cell wall biosynthesis